MKIFVEKRKRTREKDVEMWKNHVDNRWETREGELMSTNRTTVVVEKCGNGENFCPQKKSNKYRAKKYLSTGYAPESRKVFHRVMHRMWKTFYPHVNKKIAHKTHRKFFKETLDEAAELLYN